MSTGAPQVFQSHSPTRWQRFKWTFRILIFLLALLVSVIVLSLYKEYTPGIPRMKDQNEQFKAILYPNKSALIQETRINKTYQGFRKYINTKNDKERKNFIAKADKQHDIGAPVRSAFYVAWDVQSYFSLRNNISKLNMIMPEWLFIDTTADTLHLDIDQRGLTLIKASGIKVLPVLSNYVKGDFDGNCLHRILNDPLKKQKLITDAIKVIKKYHFQGINVDFEELKENADEPFTNFMKDLYAQAHAQGLLVTQDVSPLNDDYNYKELSKCNDYIFLMAYDQHHSDDVPGPISSQKWIEAVVDDALKKIPEDKLILCMAAYGYDWPKGGVASDMTYEEALSIAGDSEAQVDFDNDTYNLYYKYTDDDSIRHDVYFTDAATNFNTLRFAVEEELAGVALWRLGSEDSRIWSFYNKPMRHDSLYKFDFNKLNKVIASNNVDFIGEGEVLEVLNTPKDGKMKIELDTNEMLISEETYINLPSVFVVKKYGNAEKKIVLSFDDGPDPVFTPQILDILSKEHVPAAFFVVGINAEQNIPIVKRIYREGHEVGSHSFTHPNMAEISRRRAVLELSLTRLLIECILGHSTVMFRPPFNADSEPETMQELIPVALSKEYNYLTIGENIDPNDWEPGITADSIYNRIVRNYDKGNIILLHDAGGENREATVQALPRIIKFYKSHGYEFTTVAKLVNKKRDEMMPVIPRSNTYYLVQLNYYIAEFGFWGSRILSSLFIVCIILSILRIIFVAFLATKEYFKEKKQKLLPMDGSPLVSIIVPAHNEEVNAVSSVKNLLKSSYPDFNIIFVDDGSKDNTYEKVAEAFKNDTRVKVFSKPNGGKASALNYGIAHTEAEYLLCIDADTHLKPDAITQLIRHFSDSKVGAVAGNVKVGNEVNLLTKWQSIEYITSQNFDRRAFSYINAITVVPGAIGAFRKSIIQEVGGFTTDTLAEDCDLTVRILRAGYIIKNEHSAIAMTEAPETVKMFLKQRFRWSFGVMQTFWKNRDVLFNVKYKALGWAALPNILIFQILIPLVTPFADILMIIGLFIGNASLILEYYALFMLVDAMVAMIAFFFEKASLWKLLWLIPQRLVYRWLMLYVLFKSMRRAIKGELQHWGVLKRTGNVELGVDNL
jgi:poly-beta-1,6 N-acetyl-D-glucosamine synthase